MSDLVIQTGPGVSVNVYGAEANYSNYSTQFGRFLEDFRPPFSVASGYLQTLINELLECRNRPEPVYAIQSILRQAHGSLDASYRVAMSHLNHYETMIQQPPMMGAFQPDQFAAEESRLTAKIEQINNEIAYNSSLLTGADVNLERNEEHLRHHREARIGWAIGSVLFPPLAIGLVVNENEIHHSEEHRARLKQMLFDHRQSLVAAEAELHQLYDWKAQTEGQMMRGGAGFYQPGFQQQWGNEQVVIQTLSNKIQCVCSVLIDLETRLSQLDPNAWVSCAVDGLLIALQDLHDYLLVTEGGQGSGITANHLATEQALESLRWCCQGGRSQLNQYMAVPY